MATASAPLLQGGMPSTYKIEDSSKGTTPLIAIKEALIKLGAVPDATSFSAPSPKLEYLFEDEKDKKGPSFGARLCYGAGFTYLTGLAIGGVWGTLEGLSHPESKTKRLRINAVLNSCTRRGPFLANNLGILALMYNFAQYGLVEATNRPYDLYSAVAAAAASGYLFRASAGPRSALAASLMCSLVAATVEIAQNWKTYSYRFHGLLTPRTKGG